MVTMTLEVFAVVTIGPAILSAVLTWCYLTRE